MAARRVFKPGALLIVGMLLLAVGATVASLWYRYHETRQALALWGSEAAVTIANAERVEALRLEAANGREADLTAGGGLRIVARRDVTYAPGFAGTREALTHNRSFDAELIACRPTWSHALKFSRGENTATVLFSVNCRQVMLLGTDRRAGVGPIADVLEKLLDSGWPKGVSPHQATAPSK